MGKARKNLGLGLVCLSFVFLFNPMLAVIDLLPDVIGYLLLCIGISQLADMNYHFEEALRYFKRMILVSSIQLFSIFILFGFVTGRERPTTILLLTFTFAVIDVIFLIHAYNQFFEGFLYLGSRMDAKNVFHTEEQLTNLEKRQQLREERMARKEVDAPRRRYRRRTPKAPKTNTALAAGFTTVFIVLKAILTVLPEFTALSEQSDGSTRFAFLYDYISLFRMIAIAILLVLGIIWTVKMISYIRSIINDRPFMEALTAKYVAEIEPKTHIFIQRAIKTAFAVFGIGIAFSIDFYVDNNSILPDFIYPIIFIAALLLLRRFVKIPAMTYLLCGIHTITAAVTYLVSAYFYSNYTLSLASIRMDAHLAYQAVCYSKIADSIVFLLLMLSLLPIFSKIIKEYTGFAPANAPNVQIQDKIRYVHGMLHKKLNVVAILAILCSASSIAYVLLVDNFNFMWIIDFVFCLTLTICTVVTLNAIGEEVQYKYLLD